MSKLFNTNFIDDLLDKLEDNPTAALEDCQEEYGKVDEFQTMATHALIGFLSAYVAAIKGSPARTNELIQHKDWLKRKPKVTDVTLAATRFAMKAWETKTDLYERARIYSRVIDYYRDIKIAPEDVPDKLAVTKIAGVLKQLADQKKLAEQKQGPAQSERPDPAPSNPPTQRTPGAVPQRSQNSDTVSGSVLLRQGANGLVRVVEGGNSERVRDDNDLVPRHYNFDDTGLNDDDEMFSKRRKKVMIDEHDEIVISAGKHFAKFGEMDEDDEIVLRMRRVRDRDSWWQFRVIEARIEPDDGSIKLIH